MKKNEYDAAEVLEIGNANEIILGRKIKLPDLDSTLTEPMDWHYETE